MKSKISFCKMHGCGNDYIYVNVMQHPIADPSAAAIAWSDRHKTFRCESLMPTVLRRRCAVMRQGVLASIFMNEVSQIKKQ